MTSRELERRALYALDVWARLELAPADAVFALVIPEDSLPEDGMCCGIPFRVVYAGGGYCVVLVPALAIAEHYRARRAGTTDDGWRADWAADIAVSEEDPDGYTEVPNWLLLWANVQMRQAGGDAP